MKVTSRIFSGIFALTTAIWMETTAFALPPLAGNDSNVVKVSSSEEQTPLKPGDGSGSKKGAISGPLTGGTLSYAERPKIVYHDPMLWSADTSLGSYKDPLGCWIGQEEPDIKKLLANPDVHNGYLDKLNTERTQWDVRRGAWILLDSSDLTLLYPFGNLSMLGIPLKFYQEDPFILRYAGHDEPTTTPGAKIAAAHNATWYSYRGMWAYQTKDNKPVKIYPNGMSYIDIMTSIPTIAGGNKAMASYKPVLSRACLKTKYCTN